MKYIALIYRNGSKRARFLIEIEGYSLTFNEFGYADKIRIKVNRVMLGANESLLKLNNSTIVMNAPYRNDEESTKNLIESNIFEFETDEDALLWWELKN